MKKIVLFTWITLIVLLNTTADNAPNDYSALCEKCDEKDIYPECSMDSSPSQFNLTLNCRNPTCMFGIVESGEDEDNQNVTATVCKLRQSSVDLIVNDFEKDHIQVIPTTDDGQTETTQEGLEMQQVEGDKVTMHSTDHSYTESTSIAGVADMELHPNTGSEAEVLPEVENVAFDNANDHNKLEQEVLSSENSPDYQGDAPNVEAQASGESVHSEIPEMVNNAADVEHLETIENNTNEVTEMMVTEMPEVDKTVETTTRAGALDQKCFICSSSSEQNCTVKPEKLIACNQLDSSKLGCYTLTKAENNTTKAETIITTRGCIAELTADGIRFCKDNTKLCTLCYENGCNNRSVTSDANSTMKRDTILAFELFFSIFFFYNSFL